MSDFDHDYDYDLFVIGAGSGGVRAARMSAQHGAKVASLNNNIWAAPVSMSVACLKSSLFTQRLFTKNLLPQPDLVGKCLLQSSIGPCCATTKIQK